MKRAKPQGIDRPFKDLKALLDRSAVYVKPRDVPQPTEAPDSHGCDERELFLEAMADVAPLPGKQRAAKKSGRGKPAPRPAEGLPEKAESLKRLENLVRKGNGFVVSDTPEYMEGTGYRVNPAIAARLHRGDFAIQAHIDLHGLRVSEAAQQLSSFLQQAVSTGKRGVLIVHGRGLSSRNEPVLKAKLKEWLTAGPWRKWIVAFASARPCDGGAGATYVLLRRRPATRRDRRRKNSSHH